MPSSPLPLTVVIPAFNAEDHLLRALRSIEAQTLPVAQILVVDDASTDSTPELLNSYSGLPIQTHRFAHNRGQSAALNWALQQVSTPWVAFLDADDEWLPQKLELQLAALRSSPGAQAVWGWAEQIDERFTPPRSTGSYLARLPSALFVSTEAWHTVGPFNEELRVGAVIDWASRAKLSGLREATLSQVVYRRYIHGKNLGLTQASPASYLRVVREHLARTRALNVRP